MSKRSVERRRVGNGVGFSIFENHSVHGQWFSIKIDRVYEDGGETKYSTTFRKNDLLFVAKAAELAFSWCLRQAEKAKREVNQE